MVVPGSIPKIILSVFELTIYFFFTLTSHKANQLFLVTSILEFRFVLFTIVFLLF